jgi:hypothetical protein
LTPHTINVRNMSGVTDEILPSGQVARVTTSQKQVALLMNGPNGGVPINKTLYGAVEGLPEPAPDTLYLVSSLVASVVKRPDVISPDTGKSAIRDADGKIIAVTGFQTF